VTNGDGPESWILALYSTDLKLYRATYFFPEVVETGNNFAVFT
jgi:hypothetical protein